MLKYYTAHFAQWPQCLLSGTVFEVDVDLNTLFDVQFSNDMSWHLHRNHVSVIKPF